MLTRKDNNTVSGLFDSPLYNVEKLFIFKMKREEYPAISVSFLVLILNFTQSQALLEPKSNLQRSFSSEIGNEQCFSTITQRDCQTGEVLVETQGLAGVCPGCVGGEGYNARCNGACAPGLLCPGARCVYDGSTCWFTLHLENDITVLPACDTDGKFSAVQCRGDQITGRCFCFSEEGERIFGWDWWQKSNQMTCACSRWRHKLEKERYSGAFLRCAQNGNYEELQCTTKLCWCADPLTGQQVNGSRIVPREWWHTLECCTYRIRNFFRYSKK